jgi:hypothetical protein
MQREEPDVQLYGGGGGGGGKGMFEKYRFYLFLAGLIFTGGSQLAMFPLLSCRSSTENK